MTGMRRQLLSILIAAALVGPSAAGMLVHICHSMGGIVVGDCDCEKMHHRANESVDHQGHATKSAEPSFARLRAGRCCNLGGALVEPQHVGPQPSDARMELAKLATVFVPPEVPRVFGVACDGSLGRERGPPLRDGPPIYKRNCAFLN
jgi:hypothetical protein